jgi:O-acetylhomoserine/O-acetylserine sulfhydrylase-like pyridoxal-dependent enzyme
VAAEEMLAAVDGAETSLVFSSGMAATSTAMLTYLSAGDEVVCASEIYGGTFHLIDGLLSRLGIAKRFVSLAELAKPTSVIGPKTKTAAAHCPA